MSVCVLLLLAVDSLAVLLVLNGEGARFSSLGAAAATGAGAGARGFMCAASCAFLFTCCQLRAEVSPATARAEMRVVIFMLSDVEFTDHARGTVKDRVKDREKCFDPAVSEDLPLLARQQASAYLHA